MVASITVLGQSPASSGKSVVSTRFSVPEGYERMASEKQSFPAFLRSLPLLPAGSPVRYYTGEPVKTPSVVPFAAVLDMDVGRKDLQQSPQSMIRLWAEYLFGQQQFLSIRFSIRNGKLIPYDKWAQGMNIVVDGEAHWTKTPSDPHRYLTFRHYLDFIFRYSDWNTLRRDLQPVAPADLQPGDVLLRDNCAAMVLDMAIQTQTGEKIVLLVGGGTPAQSIHVLKNTIDGAAAGAWFKIGANGDIATSDVLFSSAHFFRFKK
jgi:hypothetical protein